MTISRAEMAALQRQIVRLERRVDRLERLAAVNGSADWLPLRPDHSNQSATRDPVARLLAVADLARQAAVMAVNAMCDIEDEEEFDDDALLRLWTILDLVTTASRVMGAHLNEEGHSPGDEAEAWLANERPAA